MFPGLGLVRILALTVTGCAVAIATSTTANVVVSNAKKIMKTLESEPEEPANESDDAK